MGLKQQVIDDVAQITSNEDDFGQSQKIIAPNNQVAVVAGFHVRHHLQLNSEAVPVNGVVASSSISEKNWLTANPDYPLRDSAGEVDLKGHKLEANDSSGQLRKYIIAEWFPDETNGLMTLKLADYTEE